MDKKTKIAIILIVLILIGTAFLIVSKIKNTVSNNSGLSKNQSALVSNGNSQNSGVISDSIPELKCQKDWKEYHQNAFGIAFCYPSSWGEASSDYLKNITRLSTLEEDFKAQNVAYNNYVDIKFENNEKVNLRIFNDKSTGKSERNIDEPYMYYESGMTSDVLNLKKSGNICDYSINYNYRYNPDMKLASLSTIHSDCANEIKTNLTKESEFFDFENIGMLYTYNLRFLAFKKLANGYFNNAIITEDFDQADQIHENLSSLDEFFTANKTTKVEDGIPTKTKEQLNQERNEFQNFVSEIKVFKPSPIAQPVFKQIPNEDPNITIIRKYYWLIAGGKLDQSYAMYSQKPADFAKYQEWYKNAMKADPRDFKNKGDNNYEFYVDYQEYNNTPTIYHVTMQIVNGQLKTVASEEITSEIVSFGPYTAFTKNIGDQNYIILTENGKEIIIDKAGNDFEKQGIGQVKIFNDPKFSPSGRYLKYIVGGWEWSGTFIYDVKDKRQVASMDGPEKFGFTEGDKYVYGCMSPGMGGGTGIVFSLPDGKKVFDVYNQKGLDQYTNFDCEYVKNKNYITFTLKQDMSNSSDVKPLPDKTFKFNLKN